MLQLVNVGHKSLADYAMLAARGLRDEIGRLAAPLEGKRVLELSATAFGGGVAEIQYTLVPLMQDAGLDVEWRIIRGADEFFSVTKAIHNALQGDPRGLSEEQRACYARYQALNADELDADEYDFVVVHDPQPLGVIDHCGGGSAKWIWRGAGTSTTGPSPTRTATRTCSSSPTSTTWARSR
jgi:trehalose synthase